MTHSKEVERIVRPIVEGQIRGFLKEHPQIAEAVNWYKPRPNDKAQTFINSLSKRIVRDLTCGTTTARLAVALVEKQAATLQGSLVERRTADEGASLGTWAERGAP